MKVSLNKAQFRAVNDLRGLPEGAHLMVMTSRFTPTGGVLEGAPEDFEELIAFVGEELAEGTLNASAARALRAMCVAIDPSSADWLGL